MQHFLNSKNIGLICPKQSLEGLGSLVTTFLAANKTVSAYNANFSFPLYLYPESDKQQASSETLQRIPNLESDLLEQIATRLGLTFTAEKQDDANTFAPIDLLDYIYAILHSPNYRETYKEFLKIDFPRVPYPTIDTFWQLVKLGGKLRQLHLLDSDLLSNTVATYPEAGDNLISRKLTKSSLGYEAVDEHYGKVWINDNQYFDHVPVLAWEFYIGGYQPAQKWLKDRHGRTLNIEDIRHYLNIITALVETDRLMHEIDAVLGEVQ